MSRIRENAHAAASDGCLASKCHDRHAHVEGITSGCAPGTRKGVECDVDLAVRIEVAAQRNAAEELDAVRSDAARGQHLQNLLPLAVAPGVQQQAGVWNKVQKISPSHECVV